MALKKISAALGALALFVTIPAADAVPGGGWRTTPTPVVKGDITAVAALDAQRAWAVGYRLVTDDDPRAVALRWNGKTWTQESELPSGAFPHAVEVRSPTDIWTVGAGVHHWDGRSWSAASFEGGPKPYFVPEALDSAADGQAWVVGKLVNDAIKNQHPVVHRWDGKAWTKQTLPDVGKGQLSTVLVVSPNDVWAAGFTSASGAHQKSLIMHWDGKTWSTVPSPTADGHTWISGLHAVGRDVFAVGGSNNGADDRPFAARWDGRTWRVTPTPPVSDGRLRAVTSTGDGEVWALGGKGSVTVALRWHKLLNRWVRVAAPDMVVRGIASVPGTGSLWAVGIGKKGDLVPVITKHK